MSRVGVMPVLIPEGVDFKMQDNMIEVAGPKGILKKELHPLLDIKVSAGRADVLRKGESKKERALHGLFRTLVANMVAGVTSGFEKTLEMRGVGYRAEVKDEKLVLNVGYSHSVEMDIPPGISVEVSRRAAIESLAVNHILMKGPDREVLGQFAANVRKVCPPEPYKGKGIRYLNEYVRRKAGKKAA
jgi:large subunit ribosomal protein L6